MFVLASFAVVPLLLLIYVRQTSGSWHMYTHARRKDLRRHDVLIS